MVASTSAVPARRISALRVNDVVPMRLVHIEISSTSSKRADAFHSVTWRTLWISKVPSMASWGLGRAARKNSMQATSK